jgi:putative transposase
VRELRPKSVAADDTAATAIYRRRMPRKLRVLAPGGCYHVFNRGNNRQPIVADDEDYRTFELLTLRTIRKFVWICWIYTLMPNHVHLVVDTPEPNLSRGMQYLFGRWGQLYNERWDRSGHVWQGRFNDRILETDADRERACNYVLANAVEADLCSSPEEWPYTGGLLATWRNPGQTRDAA